MHRIVGCITSLPSRRAEADIEQMLATLPHDSCYTLKSFAERSSGVYLGWTARREDSLDGEPVRNDAPDVITVFSGEEFSEPDAGCFPLGRGYEKDPSFPAGLNGRFHGLVVYRTQRTALLFNDRYGMHRLYYHASDDSFYFAAEAKAILAVCPETRRIDPRGMGEFVSCGGVLENRTLFEGINVFPPASAWVFRNGALERTSTYFRPGEWEEQEKLDSESYYRELYEVFTRILPSYFRGDKKIAMSLTGGLDTRMILACHRPDRGSMPCYTFGSMYRETHDVRVARRVAKACGQSHQVISAGKEFLSQFSRYAQRAVCQTDGCADVSRAPDLYLNEKAREIAPVRMSGTYGGEIMRGVRAFKPVKLLKGLFTPEFSSYIQQAALTYAEVSRCHPVTFGAFRQPCWYLYGVLALEQTQLCVRSPFLDNDLVRTVFRAPNRVLANGDMSLRLIADGNPAMLEIPTDRGLAGKRTALEAAISRAALEFQFKSEYAYDTGMPQWLARLDHAFAFAHLERAFLGRHKAFHFRVWYRDDLAGYVQEILLDSESLSRSYVERKVLESMVQCHIRGSWNCTEEIHKLLTLELLHRHVVGANQYQPAPYSMQLSFTD